MMQSVVCVFANSLYGLLLLHPHVLLADLDDLGHLEGCRHWCLILETVTVLRSLWRRGGRLVVAL